MKRIIQMIKTSPENSLFITGFENNQLEFRVSANPAQLQKENITIDKDIVYTNLYFFHISYLDKFIKENNL